jgi:hypothetical protein
VLGLGRKTVSYEEEGWKVGEGWKEEGWREEGWLVGS